MEVIRWVAVAAVASCGFQPAYAQGVDCYNSDDFEYVMGSIGFSVTFSDKSDPVQFTIIEDGKGEWVAYIKVDGAACPIAAGDAGIRTPLPPNV